MQSETGFPSSHQLKSYVASKSRLKLTARCPVSGCWPSCFRQLLPLRRYKAKRVRTRCYQERVGHLEWKPRFQGEGVVPGEYFFGFYKTRHISLSDSANCTVLRAVVLTQYRRVTDGQTDRQTNGNAIAITALAMRALRRAVKTRQVAVYLGTYCNIGSKRPCCPLRMTLNRLMSSQQFISGVARSLCRCSRVDIVVINCCRL